MSTPELKDNAYVAIVAKKYRNLKKKLEKIVKLEAHIATGKTLDEEQLILYSSKGSVEKAIADIGSLKQQLEEVAAQELLENAKLAVVENATEEVATETLLVEQLTISTQSDTVDSKDSTTQANEAPAAQPADVASIADLEATVRRLLKVFHVCLKYTGVTGNPLPVNVDFFGKTLLGQTSIGSFDDALNGSLRSVGLYLNEDLAAQHEFVRGFTFAEMSDFVDRLAADMAAHHALPFPIPPQQLHFTHQQQPAVVSPVEQEEEPEHQEVFAEPELHFEEPEPVVEAPAPVVTAPEVRQRTPRERLVGSKDSAKPEGAERTRAPRVRSNRGKDKKEAVSSSTDSAVETAPATPAVTHSLVHNAAHPASAEKKPAWGSHPHADKEHAHASAEKKSEGVAVSTEEKKKRVRVRKPRAAGEPTAAPAAGDESVPVVEKPVPEHRSGPPAKVWGGGDNLHIKESAAQQAEVAAKQAAAAPSKESQTAVRSERPSKPVVKNVAGVSESSGNKFRSERGSRPPRTFSGEPSSSSAPSREGRPERERRPFTAAGGQRSAPNGTTHDPAAPRVPRPSTSQSSSASAGPKPTTSVSKPTPAPRPAAPKPVSAPVKK